GKIGVDGTVERLEPEIRLKSGTEVDVDGAVKRAERGLGSGVAGEQHLHPAVDGVDVAGSGDVGHLDAAVDIPHIESPGCAAHRDLASVDRAQPEVRVGRRFDLEVVPHAIAVETPAAVVDSVSTSPWRVDSRRHLVPALR